MIKLAFMLHRKPGMSIEDFVDYHRNQHGPLSISIPEAKRVRRYTVSHPIEAPGFPPASYDGLTEVWFDSWDDLNAYFGSESYQSKVHPDEAAFIDMDNIAMMVTSETIVIPS